METSLLQDIFFIFIASIIIILLFNRLHLHPIIGFILTGALVGPYGLGLIASSHDVEMLSEIGVVLLLFTIGIEFSLEHIVKIKKAVLLGGTIQVGLTICIIMLLAHATGIPFREAIFLGFLVSLSSTAIVLTMLQQRAEIDTPYGRTSLAILIFQDIIVVFMMMLVPLLSSVNAQASLSLTTLFFHIVLLGAVLYIGGKWGVPFFLSLVTKTRSREVFLLSVVVLCFAVAWFTSSLGLSLALGAFLAGLIISNSEYSHQALGNILPFRDIFMSLFFVSIGMLLNTHFFIEHMWLILAITCTVYFIKLLTAGVSAELLGLSLRSVILVAFALSQVGEFSFVLAQAGLASTLLKSDPYQIFLSVSLLTMALTPLSMGIAHRVSHVATQIPLPSRIIKGYSSLEQQEKVSRKDHIVIVGYGLNGRNLARAAQAASIPYVIIEMNPDTVKKEKEKGESIYYGNATHETVLKIADILSARVLVIAIYDAAATRRIVELARRLNPTLHIIARTRFTREMDTLYQLGANEVIPEEFETSVEIFTRVLHHYLVSPEEIEKSIAEIRADKYSVLRNVPYASSQMKDLKLHIPHVEVASVRVARKSPFNNTTLHSLNMRKHYGVTVLAIYRETQVISNPHGDIALKADDTLIVLGEPGNIYKVAAAAKLEK